MSFIIEFTIKVGTFKVEEECNTNDYCRFIILNWTFQSIGSLTMKTIILNEYVLSRCTFRIKPV
jgi:hypothetical protein